MSLLSLALDMKDKIDLIPLPSCSQQLKAFLEDILDGIKNSLTILLLSLGNDKSIFLPTCSMSRGMDFIIDMFAGSDKPVGMIYLLRLG